MGYAGDCTEILIPGAFLWITGDAVPSQAKKAAPPKAAPRTVWPNSLRAGLNFASTVCSFDSALLMDPSPFLAQAKSTSQLSHLFGKARVHNFALSQAPILLYITEVSSMPRYHWLLRAERHLTRRLFGTMPRRVQDGRATTSHESWQLSSCDTGVRRASVDEVEAQKPPL